MTALVPYGAFPGFVLNAECRAIAAHYGVSWRALRAPRGRVNEMLKASRDALFWKLSNERKFSAQRIARLLGESARNVRRGVQRHEARVVEARQTMGIK